MKTCDFLIIGGGIIGINTARYLKQAFPDTKVVVLEKEARCGSHASGRNSGVLHAGFYYTPDSLKAKFTRLGNQLLTTYCEEKGLLINKCGKLVVTKNETDFPALDELLKRGRNNGVILEEITEAEAKKIEPRVKTYQRALFSPATASVNPKQVMEYMQRDAEYEGVSIHCGVGYLKRKATNTIFTNAGYYQARYIINAAGLYADRIARDFHFSEQYRILPFKGIYLYSNEQPFAIKTNIYPVPDLKNPFLGVHFTISVDGKVKIGPTAIPAFWREQYGWSARFKLGELIDIVSRQLRLLAFSQFDFRKLAFEEIKKYSRFNLVKLASQLATQVTIRNFTQFGQPGIRAQLLNIKEQKLEMDYVLEGDSQSMHILNAVSPGFTSSLPFSRYVCDKIVSLISSH